MAELMKSATHITHKKDGQQTIFRPMNNQKVLGLQEWLKWYNTSLESKKP